MDTWDQERLVRVIRLMPDADDLLRVKTFRLHLPVVDAAHADELLALVTDTEGVVAAILDAETATLQVVVSKDASALLVREQLVGVAGAPASA